MKAVTTWILVADAAHARIFLNQGPGKGISEVDDAALETDLHEFRDIDSDRPGRVYDSGGLGRHAMEPPTDPKRHEKQEFARRVAQMLEKANNAGAYDRLVLVAAPATLGDLRAAVAKPVAGKITGELAKDLVHLNMQELAGHLGDLLAL